MPADHVAASGAAGRGSPQPPRTLTIEVAREIAPLQLVLDRGLSYRALTNAMSRPRLLAALTTTPGIQDYARRNVSFGRLTGRAIPTIGYRGMHSYDLSFENFVVPHSYLVGGEAGRGDPGGQIGRASCRERV